MSFVIIIGLGGVDGVEGSSVVGKQGVSTFILKLGGSCCLRANFWRLGSPWLTLPFIGMLHVIGAMVL